MKNVGFILLAALAALAGCNPESPRGELDAERGDDAFAARDYAAAAKAFEKALEQDATNVVLAVKLAFARVAMGDGDGARQAAAAARTIDPGSAEAMLAEGQAAWLLKDEAAARAAFARVAAEKALPGEIRSQAYTALAVVEIGANAYDAARVALWRALRLDRRNAAVWYHLGHLSRVTYNFEEAAVEQYGMAAQLFAASDPRAREVQRSVIPALRESINRRKSTMSGVSNRDPEASAKLVAAAEALKAKDVKAAEAKFLAAWEKDAFSHKAAGEWARLAAVHPKTVDANKVLDAFQAAIDGRPNAQAVYQAAARFALTASRPMRAERMLSQALAHDPEAKASLDLYVDALRRVGKAKESALYAEYRKEL